MTRTRNQGGSFAASQWHSENRNEHHAHLNARLTEKNYEFIYEVAPGASAWHSEQVQEEYILRATHGAVVDGSASPQALARGVLTVEDAYHTLRELRLDMITVHDHALQAQVDRLERLLTYIVNKADGKMSDQIDDSNIRDALSRLGYKPTARDMREFSPGVVLQQGSYIAFRVNVDDDLDFEPFTWRLTVHGAHTGR